MEFSEVPRPHLQNTLVGTTIQTSPSELGLDIGRTVAHEEQQHSPLDAQSLTAGDNDRPQSQTLLQESTNSNSQGGSIVMGLSCSTANMASSGNIISRTLDKLSRSKSLSNGKSEGGNASRKKKGLSGLGRSVSQKVKNGDKVAGIEESEDQAASPSPASGPPGSMDGRDSSAAETSSSVVSSQVSSRPPSPQQLFPSRPSLAMLSATFRGDGSMRAGTQTLIQALQVIPWEDDRDDDLARGPRPIGDDRSGAESEADDDEGAPRRGDFLASSIHTIHRPVARSRRSTPAGGHPYSRKADKSVAPGGRARDPGYFTPPSDGEVAEEELLDISEDSEPDFEPAPQPRDNMGNVLGSKVGRPRDATVSTIRPASPGTGPKGRSDPTFNGSMSALPIRLTMPPRQGSMATVRLKRRVRLAEKLRDVFGLREIEEVVAEMPCWLMRSVLLQGYMYLTNAHLCFFAHMPSREDQVLKSGSLSKKAQRTKRWSKHWYVLKNDVLSWYQSSSDPYFPHGNVDLRYAISCEPFGEKDFKLRTNQKTLQMSADSVPSRDEWVKAIRKVIFKAQNHGESVKISIPFSVIEDVVQSPALDFTETIEVRVIDKDEHYADSYFFAYFHDLSSALAQIREVVQAYHPSPDSHPSSTVKDTTSRTNLVGAPAHPPTAAAAPAATPISRFGLTSLFKPLTESLPLSRTASAPVPMHSQPMKTPERPVFEDFTHVDLSNSDAESSMNGGALTPSAERQAMHLNAETAVTPKSGRLHLPHTSTSNSGATFMTTMSAPVPDHTYPPSPRLLSGENQSATSLTGWAVPNWLKQSSSKLRFFGSPHGGAAPHDEDSGHVREVYETNMMPSGVSNALEGRRSSAGAADAQNLEYSMLEAPGMEGVVDAATIEKFRTYFAFDEKEQLLGCVPGYLFRVLPVFGRIYISTNHFCFRSNQPLRKTTMIIPIRDIISTEPSRAFRFGHHGLIVIIKGHEELFFEFSSTERRATCAELLDRELDEIRRREAEGEVMVPSQSKRDALILEELEPAGYLGESQLVDMPRPPPETDTLPAVMFTSNESTFLEFKPTKSMHITCLTIGSRGDCQPYIALCKRLQKDGHRCRIATHLEYKDWIEGHGIEYGEVGGDPAELMRICVENGMFTVGFMKETLQKFRGWLDDLLKSSWDACQGTDLLIESPSAMGGIHIAEALQIPYFRAFTMPYSRTRTYPHAFAVPERKMGGSYNYMTYVMFDQVFWRAISGQINRWRRTIMGIGSTTFDKLEQHKVPFLYNFSPTVVPPPLDWYEWIRVTGYWFLDDPDDSKKKKWEAPQDLISFIDSAHNLGKKVVYIGFGSIVVSDPEAMTRAVVDAIALSGVYAILSKGWSDRLAAKKNAHPDEPEVPLPPTIYPIESIPHDWLFPKIDAACHHGGAGTTGASLRAGIPTIIKPFFGDQFFWADRVEALDVGSAVKKLTVEHLTEALRVATTDIKQIEKAKLLGQKIRAERGVDKAVEAIYRDLEYARSLIKHPNSPHDPPSDWSVISGSGDDADDPAERSSPNSKRVSLLSSLHDVIRPTLGKRLSSDGRPTQPQPPMA